MFKSLTVTPADDSTLTTPKSNTLWSPSCLTCAKCQHRWERSAWRYIKF